MWVAHPHGLGRERRYAAHTEDVAIRKPERGTQNPQAGISAVEPESVLISIGDLRLIAQIGSRFACGASA
jgi:hypothetical protein